MSQTHLTQIDSAIQLGRGAAASVLGQTYDAYRLGANTNDSVLSGSPVLSGFPARIRRTTKKLAIENTTFDLLVFEATCDNRQLHLQDVLVETGYKSDGGVFVFAQARPTRETLWVRAEMNVSITRAEPIGGSAAQQPTSGATLAPGYVGIAKRNEELLVLANGAYSFSSTPGVTPAAVPCGLQPLNRVRDGSGIGLPTSLYREHFLLYLPLLPGVQLSELDRINFPNADRYEVALVYTSDDVGLSGYICIVEKLAT